MQKLYEFTEAGFFMGTFYDVGDRVRLLPEQVKYDGHRLRPVAPEPAPQPAEDPAPAARRKARKA